MSQSIAIMILGGPYACASNRTALDFAQSVLATGRKIEVLFFYHEAVNTASELSITAQDERNLNKKWQQFVVDNGLESVVCIASALKRGIIDDEESNRYELNNTNLSTGHELSGLGQWISAVNTADKYIVFGT